MSSPAEAMPPIAVTPEQAQAMPEAERMTARSLYAQHYNRAEVERVFGAAVAPVQNNAATVRTLAGPASATSFSHVPADQKIVALKNALALGVPLEDVQRAAEGEGISWDQVTKDAAPAQQSMSLDDANQKLADTSGPYAAGTAPNDYSFRFDQAHMDGLDPSDVAAIDGMFKDAFHQAGVPLSISQPLFRSLMDAAAKFADAPDGPERTLAFRSEGARLQRLGNIAQIKADAEYAYSKMPADFRKVLDEQFMMHTAEGYHAMAQAGQLIRAREAKRNG